MSKPIPITVVWRDGSKRMVFPNMTETAKFFNISIFTVWDHVRTSLEFRDGWFFRKGGRKINEFEGKPIDS